MHVYCATIANFDAILKNVGNSWWKEKEYPEFHFRSKIEPQNCKDWHPNFEERILVFGLEVDKMFDLDIDKGIGDARKKLREQRDVTEQEKIRIQAMKNQDNSAQEFKNC